MFNPLKRAGPSRGPSAPPAGLASAFGNKPVAPPPLAPGEGAELPPEKIIEAFNLLASACDPDGSKGVAQQIQGILGGGGDAPMGAAPPMGGMGGGAPPMPGGM